MDVLNVDHVEYYVADAEEAAYRWRADYGFTRCGDGDSGRPGARAHSVLVRQGRIDLLLTSATAAAHPAYGYVSRHGDGVAVIAFTVADVRAAYQEAIGRGAVPVTPPTAWSAAVSVAEVGGFGDVVHRLVQRDGAHAPLLPGRIRAAACVPPDAGILGAIDHFAVCVPAGSLEGTARFYREVFEFEQIFEEYVEVGRQAMDSKVVQSRSGEVTFTFLEPDPAREPGQIDDFLAAHGGAGVQHLAFRTEDIAAAVRTLRERGVGVPDHAPAAYYDALAERLGEPPTSRWTRCAS